MFGYLTTGLLVLLAVTYIGFLAVGWSDKRNERDEPNEDDENDLAGMPVLQPVRIHTKERSLPARVVVWLHDVREWEVAEDWEYNLPTDGTRIVVPHGFRFNGASIPRPLWAILSPTGLLLIPGLIHDYAYRYGQLWQVENEEEVERYGVAKGRAFWDQLFWQTGRDVNGMAFINGAAWLVVYLFGCCAWRRHRKEDQRPNPPDGMTIAGEDAPPKGRPADRPK